MEENHIRKKTSRGWLRRKRERPTEILDATVSVVRERGYGNARMSDIAARAGITKGTIYLYFESKAALLNIVKTEVLINTRK